MHTGRLRLDNFKADFTINNEGGSPAQLSSFSRAETTRVKSVVTRVVATGFAS